MTESSSSQNPSSNEEENSAFDEFITHYDDSSDEEVSESFENFTTPEDLLKTFKSKAILSTWEKKEEFPLDKITQENIYGSYLGRKLLYCKEVQDTYYQVKRNLFPALVFYDEESVIQNFKNWVEECLTTICTQICDDLKNTRFKTYIKSGVSRSILYTEIEGKNFLDLAAEDPRKFYRKFVLSQSVTSNNLENLETLLKDIEVGFKSIDSTHFSNFPESLELTTENLINDRQFQNAFNINKQELLKELKPHYQNKEFIKNFYVAVAKFAKRRNLTYMSLKMYLERLNKKRIQSFSEAKGVLMECYAKSLVDYMKDYVDQQSNFLKEEDLKIVEGVAPYLVYIKSFLPKSTLHSQLGSFIKGYENGFKNQKLLEKHFIHMRNTANEGISSFENRENALVTVRTANRLARRAIKNNTEFANKIPLPVFHVFKYQFSQNSSSAAIEIEEINKNLARVSHVQSVRSYYLIPGRINIVKETLKSYHRIEYNDQDFAYWIELCLKGQSFDNWPKLDTPLVLKDYNSKLIGCLQFVSALTALLFYVEPKRNPSAFVYNLLILDLVKKGKREWWKCLATKKPEEINKYNIEDLKKIGGIMPMSKGGATCLSRWIHNAFNIPESGLGKYIYKGPLNSSTVIGKIKPNLESILKKETYLVKKWLLANETPDNFEPIKALLTEFYLRTSPAPTQQMSELSL